MAAPRLRIGCSGWNYKHWSGRFYPAGLPASAWLAFYLAHFDTVETNATFYRLPAHATFASWQAQTPDGFVMAIKASRYLTHLKRLADPEEPIARLFERARGLGPRLGPVLYQLPARLERDLPRLERFTSTSCWGDDPAGQTLGRKYVPAAMSILTQMDSTNQGVQSMVDGICSWAKNYMGAASASTANAHQLDAQMPSTYRGSGIDTAVTSAGL